MIRKLAYRVLRLVRPKGYLATIALRKSLFSKLPQRPMNYVDIGAYDGSFFDKVRKEIKINKAVLFEPQPDLSQQLSDRYNGQSDITVSTQVLSDIPGPVSFHQQTMKATSSILKIDEKLLGEDLDVSISNTLQLEATTLDLFMRAHPMHIGLLKIDVQGAEMHILRGAENTLKQTDYIWIEVSFKPLYKNSAIFSEVHTFLSERGFILTSMLEGYKNSKGELLQADCLFQRTA